ncbi:hypothetical protein OIDMADRAFT_55390 [Oidiodendron maius Zn]|uniref:Uncharacterized protein n=1 Tax=Oidiodendron maius (strain Zn) TaxID=913774 RepID=A0A0C3DBZ8_OIDMZ|nr:hypothetical protein OIDMADRAFT_55390 [Oidiodendron maius Zn]
MDDPWGSPWADQLHQPPPAPDAKGTNGLTLVPIKPGKNTAVTEKTHNPWDIPRDTFSSWTEVPVGQDIKANGELSSVSHSWESQGAEGIKKIDVSGLSPRWKESQAGSGHSTPKLSPSTLPKPTELPRQPSPDPWASVTVSSDAERKDVPEIRSQDKGDHFRTAIISHPPGTPHTTQSEVLLPKSTEVAQEPTDGIVTTKQALEAGPKEAQTTIEVSDKELTRKDADEVSRSSSSPSDQSHHDEAHSESPRTSLDDDTHRPEAHRHVSEKIQVLVEHYDALAKAQLEDTVIVGRSPHPDRSESGGDEMQDEHQGSPDGSPERKENGEVKMAEIEESEGVGNDAAKYREDDDTSEAEQGQEEGDEDFGDFEDGQSQTSEAIEDKEQTSNGREDEVLDDEAAQPPKEPHPAVMKVPQIHSLEKNFGRVKYIFDTSAVDKLYPTLALYTKHAETLFIADTIPHDSFATVEERKMWYRLSRYTTLRQHNSGDDDNSYIRVVWPESKVREETLKIAGKWMEQDRISGRVVLGGDNKDGSFFGWNDPKAAPMPLATAFAMNRGKKKIQVSASEPPKELPKFAIESHPPPHNRSPSKQRRRSSTKASRTSEEAKQSTQQPVASFGWSSNPQSVASPPRRNPKNPPVNPLLTSQNPPPSTQMPSTLGAFALAAPAQSLPSSLSRWDENPHAVQPAPPKPSTTMIQTSSNDFINDWGEMISSPVVTAPPQKPPVHGLSHKKSQSLIGISFPTALAPNGAPASSIPIGSGHRPTSSLDGILMPQTYNTGPAGQISNQLVTSTDASNAFNTTSNTMPPLRDGSYDPWASADFSVFETPAAPAKPKSAPPSKPTLTQTHKPGAKSVSFESTRAAPVPRSNGKTRQEIEQDRIVASIIRGLPDLSYMLRR